MSSISRKSSCSPGLAKLLLRLNLVSQTELEQVIAEQASQKIVAVLAQSRRIDEHQALRAISHELGIELLDDLPERAASKLQIPALGRDTMLASVCVPIQEDEESCSVALADPLDLETISSLEFILQKKVKPVLASEHLIVELINRNYKPEYTEFDDLQELLAPRESMDVLVADTALNDPSSQSVSAAPIVRLANKILFDAAAAGASDIHLEPTAEQLEVRFRIDGIMRSQLSVPKRAQPYVTARIKLLAGMDLTEKRRPQDGRFRIRTGPHSTRDIRASSVPTAFGENLVLRLLRPDIEGLSFQSLGLSDDLQRHLQSVLSRTDRLFLVTGPTGSGKTTTLYAALASIRSGSSTIVTVEDPIEFRVDGATQIQVDTKVGVTFASGLRSILRQDPDVILVGEIRDLETAEIAFQAAQTGHLVLSTLHTNDAPSAVIRLLDLGLDPNVIAASLGGILAQRLVRKVCSSCARSLTGEEVKRAAELHLNPTKMRVGSGCGACGQTGYRGRVGIYSFLQIDDQVRTLIREKAGELKISQYAAGNGFRSLEETARQLVENGDTTVVEAERVVGSLTARSALQHQPGAAPAVSVPLPDDTPQTQGSVADLARSYQEECLPEVMLIDDDRGVRAVMAKTLRRAGFEVLEAAHGKEALELLQTSTPALVICDLEMPEMNGRDFLQNIRSNSALGAIPVIMLTGLENEEVELGLIQLGADDFISKSSSPAVVLARVRRLLK